MDCFVIAVAITELIQRGKEGVKESTSNSVEKVWVHFYKYLNVPNDNEIVVVRWIWQGRATIDRLTAADDELILQICNCDVVSCCIFKLFFVLQIQFMGRHKK